ncbi:MAG: S1 RNA-binding domain-containing protein [Candidatus Micrarchaeaceae archaeon]
MIKQKNMPEVNEVVLAKVKKIMPFGAYCDLIEYQAEAFLPIKEVSPGWIKNIHEFLKEGREEVAKVIYVDHERRAIDISIKKVSKKEQKDKINDYNMEKRSESMFNQALKVSEAVAEKDQILQKIAQKFNTYSDLIFSISANPKAIDDIPVNPKFKEALAEIVSKNVKPKVYKVAYTLELSQATSSVESIKKALMEIESMGMEVLYLGSPKYKIVAAGGSYPEAEEKIKKANTVLEKYFDGDFEITKEKGYQGKLSPS